MNFDTQKVQTNVSGLLLTKNKRIFSFTGSRSDGRRNLTQESLQYRQLRKTEGSCGINPSNNIETDEYCIKFQYFTLHETLTHNLGF